MFFSVIVPVYGVEPYLRECLDSIREQSFSDFEAILVDDGSPDGCGAICDSYAAADKRFRVIHKKNGGLVSARKAGMAEAGGNYIVSLDSDDRIESGLLARAHELIAQHHPDIISFGIRYFKGEVQKEEREKLPAGFYQRKDFSETLYPVMLMNPDMEHGFYYLCGKVIRREVIFPCQMAVNEGISVGEDVVCLSGIYLSCESLYVSDEIMYHCRVRAGSDSRQFALKKFDQLLLAVQTLETLIPDGPADFAAQLDRYVLFSCFALCNMAVFEKRGDCRKEIRQYLNHPVFWPHIQNAQFRNVTPKMKITYRLMKKDRFAALWLFLRICNLLKGRKTPWL